ncbi:hypothetical protein NLI96_g2913 [Meripilus lineatus]|uniref:Uncharacterized protein n=1 Tax=Meripilus lineatus TaxID=2056292 RepID=A0AAD5V9D4_9APHY|nr:hypothetical protein NLI96_g2913 [Physisporinus lineatus]
MSDTTATASVEQVPCGRLEYKHPPQLNLDVLLHIMGYLKNRLDILRLMKTCRILYTHGFSLLLQNPVRIWGNKELFSFRDFMISDPSHQKTGVRSRYRYLHSLEFHYAIKIDDESTSAITEILASATNLEELKLDDDTMFKKSPEAFQAFLGLPQLRSFDISNGHQKTVDWVGATMAPISELDLGLWDCDEVDIFPHLANVSGTLRELTVTASQPPTIDVRFPRLKRLSFYTRESFPAAVLISAFPCLKRLEFAMHNKSHPEFSEMDDNEMRQQHEQNKAELASKGLSLYPLKYLKAQPNDLYLSAFLPQADTYDVAIEYLDEQNEDMLFRVLPFVQPSRLVIPVVTHDDETVTFPMLKRIIVGASTLSSLKLLELVIDISFFRKRAANQLMQSFVDVVELRQCSIEHLKITFRGVEQILKDGKDLEYIDQCHDRFTRTVAECTIQAPGVKRLTFNISTLFKSWKFHWDLQELREGLAQFEKSHENDGRTVTAGGGNST